MSAPTSAISSQESIDVLASAEAVEIAKLASLSTRLPLKPLTSKGTLTESKVAVQNGRTVRVVLTNAEAAEEDDSKNMLRIVLTNGETVEHDNFFLSGNK